MRYSLMSRFQGVLLGAILGELIGVGCGGQTQPERQRSLLGGVAELLRQGQFRPEQVRWSRVAMLGAESLVRYGGLEIENWNHQLSLHEFMPMLRVGGGYEMAIGTLPLALFFHENKTKGQQSLEQVLHSWGAPRSATAYVLTYAIVQALKERLRPETLIAQTIGYLQQDTDLATAAIVSLLLQVQQFLQQGTGLSAMAALCADRTDEATIALAYYCFLSTPDYPALALLRAAQTGDQPQSVCALVGVLIGAYQGVAGFPAAWRLFLTQETGTTSNGKFWTSSSAALHLGDRLFATWCGVYNPATALLSQATAVAAPGVIKPRVISSVSG